MEGKSDLWVDATLARVTRFPLRVVGELAYLSRPPTAMAAPNGDAPAGSGAVTTLEVGGEVYTGPSQRVALP